MIITEETYSVRNLKDIFEQILETEHLIFLNIDAHIKDIFIDTYDRILAQTRIERDTNLEREMTIQLGSNTNFTLFIHSSIYSFINRIWEGLVLTFNMIDFSEFRDENMNRYSYQKEWAKVEDYFLKSEIQRIADFVDIKMGFDNMFSKECMEFYKERNLFTYPKFGESFDDYAVYMMGVMDAKEIKEFIEKEVQNV